MARGIGLPALAFLFALASHGAAPVCARCHPRETARFLASAMGNSIGPAAALPAARVTHAPSGSVISVEYREERMFHVLSERGLTAEYPIAYQIGSGLKGRTYAVQVGDYLLESPLSWYKGLGWDVSPGYEAMPLIDFDRPITESCLFCHAGEVKFAGVDGRQLAASARVPAITCDRCHGPSGNHVRRPAATNIVNPAKLSGALRNSICEQCHLEGETRILNPGRTQWDYHPGDRLELTMVIYLRKQPNREPRAVTQVEELAGSKCARAGGGGLWCGSCHDPHGESRDRATRIAQVCTSCHPVLSKAAHPPSPRGAKNECSSCHMPGRPANNVAHLSVTDHRLRRPNAQNDAPYDGPQAVAAWREPPEEFRKRDLALAELQVASENKLPAMLSESIRLLEALPRAQQNSDPDVLSSLEVAFLGTSAPPKAVELSRWAVESMPQSPTFVLNYGLALIRAGDLAEAERQLLRAIELDPSLARAYAELAVLYDHEGRKADSIAAVGRLLKWNTQNIQFRLARQP
jgi:predicted CXXCH cytochrome family protein